MTYLVFYFGVSLVIVGLVCALFRIVEFFVSTPRPEEDIMGGLMRDLLWCFAGLIVLAIHIFLKLMEGPFS